MGGEMSVAMLPNSVERCSHAITILYNGNFIPYLILLFGLSLFVHFFLRWCLDSTEAQL
jgi:hypothetical protein